VQGAPFRGPSEEFSLTFLAIVKPVNRAADGFILDGIGQRVARAAGLLAGLSACAAGGDGSTSTTAITVGEATSASTTEGSGDTADDTSPETGGTAVDSTTSADDSTSSPFATTSTDTGTADPCAGELETFAVDPGWTAIGLPNGGNMYGWQNGAAHAGGDPGEIGGTLQRANGRNAYADSIGVVDAGACIAARGRIAVPLIESEFNTYLEIGHFPLAGGAGVGIAIAEDNGERVRVYMVGGGAGEVEFLLEESATSREWSYVFDPATAMMTLTIEGYGSVSKPVTPDQLAITGIDAFGIHQEAHDNASDSPGLLELYLDEIEYTR
jgi:hypothetical protein